MSGVGEIQVHLLPALVEPEELRGGVAAVIDVLRAGTTIIHALAAGCTHVVPYADINQARQAADALRAGRVILGGERNGRPIPGFDLGNSPAEYTPAVCKGSALVLTTSNGTPALLRAVDAERVLIAGFVNFSAVCDELSRCGRPVHLICAGTDGEISLEDVLLAGAIVEALADKHTRLNDSSRLAWDCFEHHGLLPREALRLSRGGSNLIQLGYDADIDAAAQIDRYLIVPELRRSPLRIEVGRAGVCARRWPRGGKD